MSQQHPRPPFAKQTQPPPGMTSQLDPVSDHGEQSYKGSGRLAGKRAIITGGDSGIGRAVAIAFAREGADLAIAYLNEDADAQETKRLVEEADRRALLIRGDLQSPDHCRKVVETTVRELGGLDILVNNAAHQATFNSIEEIPDGEAEALNRSQIVTGHAKHRDPRFPPYAFTEHGAIMAATILSSPRAVEMSLYVVRAFVRLRELLASNTALARKLDELERKYQHHDDAIKAILSAIRELMNPPPPKRRPIGFTADLSKKS